MTTTELPISIETMSLLTTKNRMCPGFHCVISGPLVKKVAHPCLTTTQLLHLKISTDALPPTIMMMIFYRNYSIQMKDGNLVASSWDSNICSG